MLTLQPPDPLLDLDSYVGQRSATFTFFLIDGVTGQQIQQLYPYRDSVPTLSHDTSRTIMRQVSNLFFDRIDTAALNTVRNRVRIFMNFPGRTPYLLGTYMFVDQARLQFTSGIESNASLLDTMFIVDQQLEQSISFNNVVVSPTALNKVMQGVPVPFQTEASNLLTIGSWVAGTNRGQVVNDLALDGDYFAPWIDNNGVMQFVRSFDPATRIPNFNYDSGNRVIRSSVLRTDDLLNAPNRFVVISNGNNNDVEARSAIVGRYDVPASAPHSIANRGFVIPQVTDRQIGTTEQAIAIAANLGQRQTIFERVALETPPDPRHNSYDVFRFDGENWLEISWSMSLIEGGTMTHVGRKSYL